MSYAKTRALQMLVHDAGAGFILAKYEPNRIKASSRDSQPHTISLFCLDYWLEANATWHRHPADVLSLFISKRWKDVAAERQGSSHRARRSRSTGFANRTDVKWWIAISERDGKTLGGEAA